MYLLYYIDKMKTVIEKLFTQCTNFYYKNEDDREGLLRIDEIWDL